MHCILYFMKCHFEPINTNHWVLSISFRLCHRIQEWGLQAKCSEYPGRATLKVPLISPLMQIDMANLDVYPKLKSLKNLLWLLD